MSDVKLNVVAGSKNDQGWKNVTASNGAAYAYKYTGGGDNNGNQEFIANRQSATFNVVFQGQDGTTYQFVGYKNKTSPTDLSGVVSSDGTVISVTDSCQTIGEFSFGATVGVRKTDGSAPDVTFDCDPVVRNKPGQI
jgi:hypothetical protein